MNILHIDCSPRATGHSRRLSKAIIDRIISDAPDTAIIQRDLVKYSIPHPTPEYAYGLASPAAYARGLEEGAFAFSEELIEELERSDLVVIGTPVNNFTVPSSLKAWIDQILRMGRTIISTPEGKVGLLKDRPVFVAISSGGIFSGEKANQPDFMTPYLTLVLNCIGLTSIRFLPLQGTAFLDEAALLEAQAELLAQVDSSILSMKVAS
jgi:FMN-dependent NADH-azoreductase